MNTSQIRLAPFVLFGAVAACAQTEPAEETVTEPSAANNARTLDETSRTEARARCRDRHPTRWAYFGDFHVHTSLSFDAYIFENRNGPDAAYRYAKGETIDIPGLDGTQPARIDRPLDFAAVTDHAEFLGEVDLCTTPNSVSFDSNACRRYREGTTASRFLSFGLRLSDPSPARNRGICGAGNQNCTAAATEMWQQTQQAAEEHYDRSADCSFTTFVAYEWTGTTGGNNLHRNVIFRNDQVPTLPVSYFEEPTPEGLWNRLDAVCGEAPCDVVAIPHNSNGSGGQMFDVEYGGARTTAAQRRIARQRARLEPLMEIYQHKGSSECALGFAADEQCSFELVQDVSEGEPRPLSPEPNDFLRGALALGLMESLRIGVNPFQLGVLASTDTHNSTPGAVQEDDWLGHTGTADADVANANPTFSPGGLVGIWAEENSRDALFNALKRKETFGTSGPRIRPRFFGGWTYPTNACAAPDLLQTAYANGVPMGGRLPARPASAAAPRFVVQAMQDQIPLQVAQIIKIDVLDDGTPREQVFNVSGNPNNGARVDPQSCQPSGPARATLCRVWVDPTFDADRPAVYYMRVLQNPTCRWLTEACNALAPSNRPPQCSNNDQPPIVQERAWTSPIWYVPPG